MNIILLEDKRYSISSFSEKIHKLYPSSSIVYANRKNFTDCIKQLESPPVFTKNWCVVVNFKGLSPEQIQTLCVANNTCVLSTSSKDAFNEVQSTLTDLGLPFKTVNNMKLEKSEIITYVSETLNIGIQDAKYICNRHRYHLPSIINSVTILSTLDNVNRDSIKRYTTRFNSISLYSLYDYLVGYDRDYSFSKVVALLHEYRYAMDYIIKFLSKELSTSMLLYRYIEEGTLSSKNIKEFKEEFKVDKVIASCSEYSIKKNIEMFSTVSYDKLYLLKVSLDGISGTRASTYKLINLLKVGG